MNVLVNISDEIYRHAKDGSEDSNDEWNAMRAIANGTPISDNATNGEVIINIFDVKEIHTMTTTAFAVLQDGTELEFKRSWWDESYKKGGKE